MRVLLGPFNKKKSLLAFSGHCESSRSPVDSSRTISLYILIIDCVFYSWISRVGGPGALLPPLHDHPHAAGQVSPAQPKKQEVSADSIMSPRLEIGSLGLTSSQNKVSRLLDIGRILSIHIDLIGFHLNPKKISVYLNVPVL